MRLRGLCVKALATVSAAGVGRMTRNGGVLPHQSKESPDRGHRRRAVAHERGERHYCRPETAKMFNADPHARPPDVDSFFKDASRYCGTRRGRHERSDQSVPPTGSDLMVSYGSFAFQHLVSPRPLLMVAGSEAQTLHHSGLAVGMAREPKELYKVEGKSHFDLYDDHTVPSPGRSLRSSLGSTYLEW